VALTCVEGGTCTNPGLRRPDALLAIVILSEDDDCSARDQDLFNTTATATLGPPVSFRCFEFGVTCDQTIDRTPDQTLTGCRSKTADDAGSLDDLYLFSIDEYFDFFSSLAPQGRVVLAGITGPYTPGNSIATTMNGAFLDLEPACSGPTGEAAPGVRINELIRRFGAAGIVLEDENSGNGICTNDFGPALSGLGDAAQLNLGSCVPARLTYQGEAVTDPADASCAVTEVVDEASLERERCEFSETPPVDCSSARPALSNSSPIPCWYMCGSAGCEHGWHLGVCRDPSCDPATPAPANTTTNVDCTACDPEVCDDCP
jgi:hypothetical protein